VGDAARGGRQGRQRGSAGGLTYAESGVDIDAADRAVEGIRDLVNSTRRPEVVGGIGGFGGLFAVPSGYRFPLLVASTDGVGTKMAVAAAAGRLETVGIDLVAMCVDDLVCCGAEPLFFLDYQLLGRVDPAEVRAVIAGIAAGCREAGCTILGGELAEHPGLLPEGQLDVAGFAVGMVERDRLLDGRAARPGDVLIGLRSPGLRSNGYSLARRALLERPGEHGDAEDSEQVRRRLAAPAWDGAARSLADELLEPSVIYAPGVRALLGVGKSVDVHAVAHITGGGLAANLRRALPAGVGAVVERGSWEVPRIFAEVQAAGGIDDDEMQRVFNLGVGMVIAVAPSGADTALEVLGGAGRPGVRIGELVAGDGVALRP
jgi:phosphoribosylformylglycinamidine cyclo-ligase